MPINQFLSSLALEREANAASIILSGTGSDGSLGARDIKLNGGFVLAQDPTTAKYDGMPTSVIYSGYVDFIVPPEQMPTLLNKWLRRDILKEGVISSELSHIFYLIRAKTGYDFSFYKLTTIQRRIEKQMLIHNLISLTDYVAFLDKNPDAVDQLFKDFLIGVTRFFRDTDTFDTFGQGVLPKLLANKPKDFNLRVWVPGCSTGEEVYTIAIIVAEYMEQYNCHFAVQIFGTDIDCHALMVARGGQYGDHIKHDVNPERLKKYFTKEKGKYKVSKEIRRMVMFGEQNLIKDPPFTRVDIISCRNLLIYLNVRLQKRIIPMFHYSLNMPGALILGSSESIGNNTDLFEPFYKKMKIFANLYHPNSRKRILNLPDIIHDDPFAVHVIKEKFKVNENSASNDAIKKLLLEQYLSPCFVVNTNGDILYLYGTTNKYIKSTPIPEKFNISYVARNDIKRLLKTLLISAINKKTEVTYHDLQLKDHVDKNLSPILIDIKIIPITHIESLRDHYLIIFIEAGEFKPSKEESAQEGTTKQTRLEKNPERELIYTKENLQATIEELESSNEELQSLNEELQSTNEELETSKEELHSLNEELVITNTELQTRIDQLATVHDDMTNLFNSTEIATFFLDNNLCIKRFTPKAQDFIHVIPADIGRSISHFTTTLEYDHLMDDAKEVLRTLNQKMLDVKDKSGKWFQIRILPYRTISNMIDGVIVTLSDISEHKDAEKKLGLLNATINASLTMSKHILDTVMMPLLVLNPKNKVISANRAFYKFFHVLPDDVIGSSIFDIKGWNLPALREILAKDFPPDQLFEGFELEAKFPKSGSIKLTLNVRKILGVDRGEPVLLIAMCQI